MALCLHVFSYLYISFLVWQVLVEEKLSARILALNRPRQLNALSFQMVSLFGYFWRVFLHYPLYYTIMLWYQSLICTITWYNKKSHIRVFNVPLEFIEFMFSWKFPLNDHANICWLNDIIWCIYFSSVKKM